MKHHNAQPQRPPPPAPLLPPPQTRCSILKTIDFKRPCDQFVLLHLQRQHLLEWVRAMIAVTLGVGLDSELPPVLLQDETDNAWNQISKLTITTIDADMPVCMPMS